MDNLTAVGLLSLASHRAIITAVEERPFSMTALARRIGLSLSGTSWAAWRLQEAGLVRIHRRGRKHYVLAKWRSLRLVGERI